tara:strand:- start:462 stop:977 length:516 start_codon:yes stop_codon:yes gene_type:complete
MSTYIAAISVIPSDTINIPQPGVLDSGTSTAGAGAGKIEDTGAEWTNAKTNLVGYNIENGDVVYNTTDSPNNISQISKVDSDTVLSISTNVFQGATDGYEIYKGNQAGNNGYSFYVGTSAGDKKIKVLDISGNQVTLEGIEANTIYDLQIVRVYSTGTSGVSNIVALEKSN